MVNRRSMRLTGASSLEHVDGFVRSVLQEISEQGVETLRVYVEAKRDELILTWASGGDDK